MQTAEDSTELRVLKTLILVLSPPASAWSLPGPWQPSQPLADAMCGVVLNAVTTSSWHWTHVSMPAYSAVAAAGVAGAAGVVDCAPPALANPSKRASPRTAASVTHPLLRIQSSWRLNPGATGRFRKRWRHDT